MKVLYIALVASLCLLSCNTTDDAPESQIQDESTDGFILRTLDISSNDFILGDGTSAFEVMVELNDGSNRALIDEVQMFARYIDNDNSNGINSSLDVLIDTIEPDRFGTSSIGLPTLNYTLSLTEISDALGLTMSELSCADQFRVRFNVVLNTGVSYSSDSVNARIISILDSPFEYVMNVVSPIESNAFLGIYAYETITNGFFGPSFGSSGVVEIKQGSVPTRRSMELRYILNDLLGAEPSTGFLNYDFTIACDFAIFSENQIAIDNNCIEGSDRPSINGPILLGPDQSFVMSANADDDSVFDLYFVEGYNGWDGTCDLLELVSQIRFTKQ